MNRRYVALSLIFLLLLVGTELKGASEVIQEQNVIIVDKANQNTAYTSIQAAIDDAVPGSTIYVKKGIYNEVVLIKKSITVIGEKGETAIHATSTRNGCAVEIRASDVTLNGLTIKNSGPGLYATGLKINCERTTITDCTFSDTPIGIAVWSSENTIKNCIFTKCSDEGIALLGSQSSRCTGNIISNCEFLSNCDGIELQYAIETIISSCKFYRNTHCGIDAIFGNIKNTIESCEFSSNVVHGIYLSLSSENTISHCKLSDNKDGNIAIAAGSFNNKIQYEDTQEPVQNVRFQFIRNTIRSISSLVHAAQLREIKRIA